MMQNEKIQKCVMFDTSPKVLHYFLGIHHYIVNLLELSSQ